MTNVTVIDYGIGNVGSILNMYRKLGIPANVATSPEQLQRASRLILPGIGAFDACVDALTKSGLREPLLEFAASARPLLGICVGMQMLTDGSEEGGLSGLGLVPGFTRRFDSAGGLRVPHMGWNDVAWTRPEHALARDLERGTRFYFVHSYWVSCRESVDCIGTSTYGFDFACAISRGNVSGVQFHPEKSHRFGLQLLKNFATL